MNFTNAIRAGFAKYANFSGRASRSEFWWLMLFLMILGVLASIFDAAFLWIDPNTLFGPVGAITSLATFLPSLSATARRLHDIGRSGWWMLLLFVPLVGWAVLLYWNIKKGDTGPNSFGADPLAHRE